MDLVPTLAIKHSGSIPRWTLFATSISLILQQDDDQILTSLPWIMSSCLLLPQGNTLGWTLIADPSQPSLNGRMASWGYAL